MEFKLFSLLQNSRDLEKFLRKVEVDEKTFSIN